LRNYVPEWKHRLPPQAEMALTHQVRNLHWKKSFFVSWADHVPPSKNFPGSVSREFGMFTHKTCVGDHTISRA